MFSKLVIAFLMAYLARADDMTPLSACPLDPPTSFNVTCAVNLTCSWTLEGNGVETCTCEEEGTIQCYALAPPISVISRKLAAANGSPSPTPRFANFLE